MSNKYLRKPVLLALVIVLIVVLLFTSSPLLVYGESSPKLTLASTVSIISVNTISDITVSVGTPLNQVGLPAMVDVDLDDESTVNATITWDSGIPSYDGDTAGTYVFTGNLNLPDGISNPEGYTATVNVVVVASAGTMVASVNTLSDIQVTTGTALDQVSLPDIIEVTLDNNSTTTANINWDNGTPLFDGSTTGTYVFTGNLNLPDGISNPEGYTATVNVIVVASAGTMVASVNTLSYIQVTTGTTLDQVSLPDIIEVTLDNNSTTTANINWDNGTPLFDGSTTGTYVFTGTLILPSGVSNPNCYTSSLNVLVGIENADMPKIASGYYNTLAIKSNGTVWAWGANDYGQIGDGTTTYRYVPVQVQGLMSKTITDVAIGNCSSYFLASDGTVWSTGRNNYGQLGDGTTTDRSIPVQVQGLSEKNITALAATMYSAYFLASDGTVWAVGNNEYGQLGDGTTTSSNLPVQVLGLNGKIITAIAAGERTGYFLVSDGTAWAVGYNGYYQLGDGSGLDQSLPVQVQGLDGKTITSISGGLRSAYFLAEDSTVWAVGYNNHGQLGDGTTDTRNQVVQVQGLSGQTITGVAAGSYAAYFLTAEGTVWAVGSNEYGQLGDASTTDRYSPVQVQGLSGKKITAIAGQLYAGYFQALDGTLWATGYNPYGQIGDGSALPQITPVKVLIELIPSIIDITSPAKGLTQDNTPLLSYTISEQATVVVKVNDLVVDKVSGENLEPLLDGFHTVRIEATDTNNNTWISSVTFLVRTSNVPEGQITGGYNHGLALNSDGTVWAWGVNDYGELGDGTTVERNQPVQVQGLSGKTITATAGGSRASYFLTSDGTVWAIGQNIYGKLGDGTTSDRMQPVQVQGLSGKTIISMATGAHSAYFLASDGTVWAVGYNQFGQLGDGTTIHRSIPVQIQGLSGKIITAIASGDRTVYFLASDGTVWSLGYNNYGQLANGTSVRTSQPVKVQGLEDKTIKSINGGHYSVYFLASDGTVWSAGSNEYGQLGDGTTTDSTLPVRVQGLSNETITEISSRGKAAYFLTTEGTVWAVGINEFGQLGDGTTTNRSLPVQVQGFSDKTIIDIDAGFNATYFLASDGTVWSVGYNEYCQLGDGTRIERHTPVQVSELMLTMSTTNVTSVESINDITVPAGTALNEIGLPETVTINLDNSSIATASITWDSGTPSYNGDTAGIYVFTGTLTIPNGITNPDGYTASINVIVILDITPPEISFNYLQPEKTNQLIINVEVNDDNPGYDRFEYTWTETEQQPETWIPYTGQKIELLSCGDWYLHVKARDNAGNETVELFGPVNNKLTYQYDGNNRLENIVQANEKIWTFRYDNNGNLLQRKSTFPKISHNLNVVSTQYDDFQLSWDEIQGADRYKVYIEGKYYGTITTNSFTSTLLEANTQYLFEISAVVGNLEGKKAAIEIETTP